MKTKVISKIIFGLFSIGIVISTVGFVIPWWESMPRYGWYKGQVVFNSESEYSRFKQELIDTEASWSNADMQVLYSEPPIIVRFKNVIIDEKYVFPYGEVHYPSRSLSPVLFVMGLVLVLVYACLVVGYDDIRWLFR